MAEDFGAMPAVGAVEVAHVLDDAQHRHVDPLEHVEPPSGVQEGDVLGRRHQDGARQRHALRHGELGVAGAGRHVHHQHVELAPLNVAQHLLERPHHHRPAPDHRRVLGDQEADGHALDAIVLHRDQDLAVGRGGPAGNPHHPRHRRPVDIGVEHADLVAGGGEPEGEVDGDGRFADTALARGHGDDGADARHQGLLRLGLRTRRRRRCRPSGLAGG